MNTILKRTIAISIVMSLAFSLNAQKFNYGLKAGSNFTVQSELGYLYNNEDIKLGLHAGVFGNLFLSENFGLQAEINYDQKGSAANEITNSYYYLTIPVFAKWSLGKSSKIPTRFSLYAGPYAAYLLNAESKNNSNENPQTIDVKSNTNDTEFGVAGGFTITYPLKHSSVFLDFRLGVGLTEYDKIDKRLRNKYFAINLGIEF